MILARLSVGVLAVALASCASVTSVPPAVSRGASPPAAGAPAPPPRRRRRPAPPPPPPPAPVIAPRPESPPAAANGARHPPKLTAGEAAPAADEAKPYYTVRLYFGTDRNRTGSANPADMFGEERGHTVVYGSCEVSIPRSHQPGELDSPFVLLRVLENPNKHVVLLNVQIEDRDQLLA